MSTALITGASTGIGYELALYHASKGGDLVIIARSGYKLEALKAKIEQEFKTKCHVISMDLTGENAAKNLLDEISSKNIKLDILINNAGVGFTQEFTSASIGTWQQMIQLNINSLTELCYYFSQQLINEKRSGKILNVASTAAFQGIPYMAVYSATKSYVLSFTEALSDELKKDNISVTALCPGPTRSNFGASANLDERMSNSKLLPTAESVAKFGYDKMLKGDAVAIHGAGNKLGTIATQVIGRRAVGKVAGEIFKRIKK